ncbi:MAG: aldehyde dehydrogenase family protein [Bryobacteraceae bacterium]|nr:aldehyde dehydrogenase family protein [Bryobacteraceae bacterium]
MKIGIIGAGKVATGLARYWTANGHEVRFGVRAGKEDPAKGMLAVSEAATFGDVIVLAVPFASIEDSLTAAGGGTRKINGKGLFIEPTLFANAINDLKISREEIFGPVLPIIPFEGEEEAIRIANDTSYGLASGIQTGDMRRALRLADKIKAGTVWLNTWHKYHPNAPFGGFKMSGYGREQGAEALENYTQYKTIWANLG